MPPRYAQGKYWLLTIPHHLYQPFLGDGMSYIKGQLERGEGGFLHWQVLVCYTNKVRAARIKVQFGDGCHCELSRSAAANEYVWKEETRIEGTQFSLGELPINRNSKKDWDGIWDSAKRGAIDEIPSDVRVRSYSTLRKIQKDYAVAEPLIREVTVYVGPTGTGKSRRAWEEAGFNAFPKDPCTKFWDGYQDQQNVIFDEFRGQIGISHVLRWFDRYPCIVENKGGAIVFKATRIWVTSNLHPRLWYPELDQSTYEALERRLTVIEMNEPYYEELEN
nr:MAG: replication associated protein [Cressdnaviricota sp.]